VLSCNPFPACGRQRPWGGVLSGRPRIKGAIGCFKITLKRQPTRAELGLSIESTLQAVAVTCRTLGKPQQDLVHGRRGY